MTGGRGGIGGMVGEAAHDGTQEVHTWVHLAKDGSRFKLRMLVVDGILYTQP